MHHCFKSWTKSGRVFSLVIWKNGGLFGLFFSGAILRFFAIFGTLTLTKKRQGTFKKKTVVPFFIPWRITMPNFAPHSQNHGAKMAQKIFLWQKKIHTRTMCRKRSNFGHEQAQNGPKTALVRLICRFFYFSWTTSNVNQDHYEVCWCRNITSQAINVVWWPKRQNKILIYV